METMRTEQRLNEQESQQMLIQQQMQKLNLMPSRRDDDQMDEVNVFWFLLLMPFAALRQLASGWGPPSPATTQ